MSRNPRTAVAKTAARPSSPSYAKLEARVAALTAELHEAREQQTATHGILAHGVHDFVVRDSADDLLPVASGVVRTVDVRMQVIELEAIDRGVRGFVVEVRRLH